MRKRYLVVGGGGREHAIVWRLRQDCSDAVIYCAPGNAGIAEHARCVDIKATDIEGLRHFAVTSGVDLTIVGPEAPLVAGIVDRFKEEGLRICGPSAAAAEAEASKVWFKGFLARHGIPTARFKTFDHRGAALGHISAWGASRLVIKADGLMGGKGVFLPETLADAENVLSELMVEGGPGESVVIEERLVGVERSVMAAVNGKTFKRFALTQDYKLAYNGDKGPNTGGMGAHTLELSPEEEEALFHLVELVIHALVLEGRSFKGFIYLGVMMTADGPKILECNVRLGDPEAQVILPSMAGDFAALCSAVADDSLGEIPALVRDKHALCVVLASQQYPEPSECDDVISSSGLLAAQEAGALLLHAGTGRRGPDLTTNKAGRGIGSVGVSDTLMGAHQIAYAGARAVGPPYRWRDDIGEAVIKATA